MILQGSGSMPTSITPMRRTLARGGWLLLAAIAAVMLGPGAADAQETAKLADYTAEKMRLVIRIDDIGFCHASNMALERLLTENGCVTAVSVLVNGPWFDETVEILKAHPEVSVGVHICLNSEWRGLRWGPVLPANEVPTLVDKWGHFYGTRADMMANNPSLAEIDKEIRAQIDRALAKGLKLSYLDHHMGAAVQTPEMRAQFEKIAADYRLAISRYFGERYEPNIYSVPPANKLEVLTTEIDKLSDPGIYLLVAHVGANTPELSALKDLNLTGLVNMAEHRQAELDALCDPRFRQLLDRKQIELVGYDTLQQQFLKEMKRSD